MAGENNQNFWFMMSNRERQQATAPWGPGNPQDLNRFSYVSNNPLKYIDPSGHYYEKGGDNIAGYENVCVDGSGKEVSCNSADAREKRENGHVVVRTWITDENGNMYYKDMYQDDPAYQVFKENVKDMISARNAYYDAGQDLALAEATAIAVCLTPGVWVICGAALAASTYVAKRLYDAQSAYYQTIRTARKNWRWASYKAQRCVVDYCWIKRKKR